MPTAYAPGGGSSTPGPSWNGAQEAVGDLDEDPGAVARVRLGTRGAAVLEVGQRPEPGQHQVVAGNALDVGHERDAARVVLESRVVETRWPRRCVHRPSSSTTSRGSAQVDARDDAVSDGRVSLEVGSRYAKDAVVSTGAAGAVCEGR